MKISFRRMQLEDIAEIFTLEKLIFKDFWPVEHFVAEVENTSISYPVIMYNGLKIVGYAVVWKIKDEANINNFAIVPDFRRNGYGAQLLSHIVMRFKDCAHLFLEVRQSNLAAIRLYEKFGFTKIDVRRKYYSDSEDALIMHKGI